MEYKCIYKSKIGDITITADENALLSLQFGAENTDFAINPVIKETIKQLDEYFSLKRKNFDLPLNPKGTEFQKRVWKELTKIPYGETRTYKQTALAIGNPNASRAIGNANNKNPIAIIIPCHRVIGSDGSLTGYAAGLNIKEFLLKLEQQKKES